MADNKKGVEWTDPGVKVIQQDAKEVVVHIKKLMAEALKKTIIGESTDEDERRLVAMSLRALADQVEKEYTNGFEITWKSGSGVLEGKTLYTVKKPVVYISFKLEKSDD